MSEEDTQSDEGVERGSDEAIPEPTDEKEQAIQRRFARIEEALGLSPFT
ncbi:hypothetical protein JET76_03260 [Pseudomonas putida]|nr:hypothetical protein [Pseudomonas putida]MBI6940351.1 hypothetical protein [Pseudomonas putida]MBI6960535.1 hypothetical protein [Pseudomonas putida]